MKISNPSSGKHDPVAITRVCQPARIEFELLAQFSELARRGSSEHHDAAQLPEHRSCEATKQDKQRESDSLTTGSPHPTVNVARERVA